MKRAIDIAGAGVGLTLSLPLLVVLALAVWLTSPGPAFFRQVRLGLHGRRFHCYKLRTMVQDAEELLAGDPELHRRHRKNGFKLPTDEDPRVTAVGRILRRTHLDELPQLWNVLKGDLSLVGPRPIVPEELVRYGSRADDLLALRPGIFGAWTAEGRNRPDYPERVAVELSYTESTSRLEDFRILLRHLPVLARGQEDWAVADEPTAGEAIRIVELSAEASVNGNGNGHANGNGNAKANGAKDEESAGTRPSRRVARSG